jgi:polyisoprenoid-binding protein YceI
MRTIITTLALLLALEAGAATSLPGGTWRIDPQRSTVTFTVTKLQTKVVNCRFSDFRGEVRFDPKEPQRSFIRWAVRVDSVQTGEPDRDSAIASDQFLDARRFPELTFVSRRVSPLPDGRLRVEGTIAVHGQQRPLVIVATPVSTTAAQPVFETRFVLNRADFGVEGTLISKHAISREVNVHLWAVGVRQ